MSKATVKKALKELDHDSLVEMVMDLYSARKEAREYLEFWVDPDIDREVENLKTRLWKAFFLPQDKPRRKPGFTEAKQLMKNFLTLCHEPDKIADILLYYPETILRWLRERKGLGMTANKTKLFTAIDTAKTEIETSGNEDTALLHRLEALESKAEDFYRLMPKTTISSRHRRWFKFS